MPEHGLSATQERFPDTLNQFPPLLEHHDIGKASHSYRILIDCIKKFEDSLDDDHEVSIQLASFGESVLLAVTNIGYANPSTLVFHGYVGTKPATLVQHMSQLSFLLLAVEKPDPDKPPRRIGFALPTDD